MRNVAIYRAPKQQLRRRGPIGDSARRAMELAALALTDSVPALLGEEALAERDRLRRTRHGADDAQGSLLLTLLPDDDHR
ncbi:TPA: hypothetical protein QDZ99_004596 [Stenotrophomonas maltophilia]|nr:hypothetical protein [Stenotrophomonas maltophilia]HDS1158856.1 hypothetical protein [Stenotrophomonas maltophilia]HDS1168073.1 hypothetical protein [Stenotrophomonas maltophilia]HDS1172834.1 hypothetical protein [Stenotrophomonas maltophilia]HDS1177509.1 hypothetical protein [Stenotrophomonas maltophilia]